MSEDKMSLFNEALQEAMFRTQGNKLSFWGFLSDACVRRGLSVPEFVSSADLLTLMAEQQGDHETAESIRETYRKLVEEAMKRRLLEW